MKTRIAMLAVCISLFPCIVLAKECWAISGLAGQVALSADRYVFKSNIEPAPAFLCFDGEEGSVTGDDTKLTKLGTSTLVGWGTTNGMEGFEVYQIDRASGHVLFTKTRIGTDSFIPGGPDIVGALVGKAVRLKE